MHIKPTLTIGIAAYNEEVNIAHMIDEIMKQKQDTYKLAEILIITDGCTDRTDEIVADIARHNKLVKLVTGRTNRGKQYRMNQMFAAVKTDGLVNFDADVGIVGDQVLNRAMDLLNRDPKAQLISIHQRALRGTTFIARVLHASFAVWDEVRLSVPGYQTVHNFYGAATLYRGDFARSLRIPDDVHDERTYQYLMAQKLHGYRYIRDSEIVYWPIMTISDWTAMTRRSFGKAQPTLAKMFNINIEREYHMPRRYVIIGTLKAFVKNPIYTPFGLIANILVAHLTKIVKPPSSGKWEVAKSSKLPIPS